MSQGKRSTEERVIELEISLAHQQRLCEQLNEVVTDQTKRMMELEAVIPRLERELKELRQIRKPAEQLPIEEERPPHY